MLENLTINESKEILPANSDYWVTRSTESGEITIGKRGSKETALILEEPIGRIVLETLATQKAVEEKPILHLHDEDLELMRWGDTELVHVRRVSKKFGAEIRPHVGEVGGFDNPLVAERSAINDVNCHTSARNVSEELYFAAVRKIHEAGGRHVDKEGVIEAMNNLSFPIVVRIYRNEEEGNVKENYAPQHSLVVIGRDVSTDELICYEKTGGGLPYRLTTFDTIFSDWDRLLGKNMYISAAGEKKSSEVATPTL